MATIESYTLADGSKRYRVRYRTPDRRQTDKRGFKTKHEAADFAATVEVTKLQGLYVQPSHGRLLTGPWVVDWLTGRGDLARSSQVRYEGIINEHIVPKWGKVALADVRHIDIQRWCTELTHKGLAAATVDKVHRVLSQALDLAVLDQRIPRNPANGVKIARPNISPRRYLTHAQVEHFAQAAGQWGDVIRVLAYTGIRWGEMAALEVGSIDLDRRRASIYRTVVDTKGGLVWKNPKGHSKRAVPIPASILDGLARSIEGRPSDELVFRSPKGTVLRVGNARPTWWNAAVLEAELPAAAPN